MAEHQLPKLTVRVRFPSPAPRTEALVRTDVPPGLPSFLAMLKRTPRVPHRRNCSCAVSTQVVPRWAGLRSARPPATSAGRESGRYPRYGVLFAFTDDSLVTRYSDHRSRATSFSASAHAARSSSSRVTSARRWRPEVRSMRVRKEGGDSPFRIVIARRWRPMAVASSASVTPDRSRDRGSRLLR